MRRTFLFIALAAVMASCGEAKQEAATEAAAATEQAAAPEASAPIAAAGKMDPICQMERDTAWTEYSVHNGDTTWFCSEHCKKTFDANPDKYTKPKAQ